MKKNKYLSFSWKNITMPTVFGTLFLTAFFISWYVINIEIPKRKNEVAYAQFKEFERNFYTKKSSK